MDCAVYLVPKIFLVPDIQPLYIIPFSDNVCDKSGKLCHCIIPVSDNVRDISGQLPCRIFWICVWHIRKTVSLYQPFFRQCLWHIRPNTLSKAAMEGKKGKKRRKKVIGELVATTLLPINCLMATNCNAAAHANFLTMCVTYHKSCINSSSHFQNNVCDNSKSYYFLAMHDV